MGKRVPKDAFSEIEAVDMQKGRDERLILQPWVRNGFAYISLGIMERKDDGTYAFLRRKGFAISVREAKELVMKLAALTYAVEARMYETLEESVLDIGPGGLNESE